MAEVYYHYCSNSAFLSIIQQRRLRLSLLTMSNDADEGRHIVGIVRSLLPTDFAHKDALLKELQEILGYVRAIGFCVSTEGDMLSQWRGYADNAQGVAIGFDGELLPEAVRKEDRGKLILNFEDVSYEDESAARLIGEDLRPVIEFFNTGRNSPPVPRNLLSSQFEQEWRDAQREYDKALNELCSLLLMVSSSAYRIKSPFFREEAESRILGLVTAIRGELGLPDAEFAAEPKHLKPFRMFPSEKLQPEVICEVVLGPRNQTPVEVMRLFLTSHGLAHVRVRASSGSYR